MSEREEFEKWAKSYDMRPIEDYEIDDEGYYEEGDVQRLWSAWQAAREFEGGEAVALRCTEKHGSGVDVVASVDAMETYKRLGRKIEPLYIHPPKQQSGVPEPIKALLVECEKALCSPDPAVRTVVAAKVLRKLSAGPPATPQPDKWIPCSERLPTEADGDYRKQVWAFLKVGTPQLLDWHSVANTWHEDVVITHWMPTGLTHPAPPEQESDQ